MTRVLRVEGRLLVSGKNDNYHDDDEEALMAELNARAKGFPNRFTNFDALDASLLSRGLRATEAYYFERRGDLSLDHASLMRPARFYEYVLFAQNVQTAQAAFATASVISETVSQTFRRRTRCRTAPR